jgi:Putative auto-transporter adhesin, head GIN domain
LDKLMKRQWLALPAAALLLMSTSCGFFRDAGAQTTEQRSVQGVTAVELLTSGDLVISVGSVESLTVTAGANQLVGLTSQVIDGTLILDNKANTPSGGEIRYALTVPPLNGLELRGSGSAEGVGVLTGDSQLRISGSGAATLTGLDLETVTVDLSGSGNVELAGRASAQHVTVSGSGNYNGSGLVTHQADVTVSGSGNASVDVTGQLTASVSGSGDIGYTGNPANIDRSSSGSGAIVPG